MSEALHEGMITGIKIFIEALAPYLPIIVLLVLLKFAATIIIKKIQTKHKIDHTLNININKEDIKEVIREIKREE